MPELITQRPTAPFVIFYRTASGEGGFSCQRCSVSRSDSFSRASDVFAVAAQHLNICRSAMRHRPIEGTAIIDGRAQAAVLREGILVVSLKTVFRAGPLPVRVVA